MKSCFTHLIVIFLLTSLCFTSIASLSKAGTPVSNVSIYLNGPSVIGTLHSESYSATMVDPDARTWNYKIWVTAANTTGASPQEASPVNGTITPENNTFKFDITGQQDPGQLEIHINCTIGTIYYEKVQPIFVVEPIVFNVGINNPSNVKVQNATVKFYVDGEEINNQVIDLLDAKQSTQVTAEWITRDPEPGWHDSRIVVDLNSDGQIDKDIGDMVIEERFYVEGSFDLTFALIVMVGLTALLIGFAVISKRKLK